MDGQVRIMMCETTQMAQRAADIHHATPVCTAAMGRLMTATSMLGVMMKGENESVTVNIKGGGPMGTVVAVANHGDLKDCADDPQVELPLREDGKLLLRSLEPQRAVTPGQSAVLYLGEKCIGGGVVEEIFDTGKTNIPGV